MKISPSILYFILLFTIIETSNVFGQTELKPQIIKHTVDSIIFNVQNSEESDSIKISKLNKVIANNRYQKHTIKAIRTAQKIAISSGDKVLIADNFRSFGNYYFYNSQLDSAEYYLVKSKKLAANYEIPFIKAAIDNALGGVYRKKGNVTKAIRTVLNAKTTLESIDTLLLTKIQKKQLLTEQLTLFNTLANFYNQMEDFTQAISNYEKAYSIAIQLNATKYAGVILSNKGDLLLKNGEFEEALLVLKQAKELKLKGQAQESSIAITNQNISLALLKLKDFDIALLHINDALDYYKKANTTSGLMEAYAIRGQLFYKQGNYQKAIKECTKAKDLALENGVLDIQEKTSLCLSESYEAIGDLTRSFSNFKEYKKVKDSIFNQKNIKKITQLEMQHNYDKENQIREMQNAASKKENRTTIAILLLSIVSLLLISSLLLRQYYMRKKANSILKEKNKKITETLSINETLFKETHHRVKNNLQIISSLLNMQTKFLDDSRSKEIVADSQNRIKSMSLIHQKLYQENNITGIETKAYFTELISSLAHSYGIDATKVSMQVNIESLLLDVDTAIPLGLILNEIISNAFKHGVDQEKGIFTLSFSKSKDNTLLLLVKDNGAGISDDFDWKNSKSYGMKLIHTLSKKLKAAIQLKNNNGLEINMVIKKFKLSK